MQKQKKIISLDIDETSVVATALSKRRQQVHLERYAVVAELRELAADLFFRSADVIIQIPSQVVLFRSFHLASSFFKGRNMQKDILAFLQRQNLPFRLEDCYWHSFAMDSNLNFVAARKEAVDRIIHQVEAAGFQVSGVCAPIIALYNVLIHTYPERSKERFSLLNIKTSSSDLVIYEAKRLWIYSLPMGSRNLQEPKDALENFSIEIQRILNSHNLSNPPTLQNVANYFYVTGKGFLEPLVPSLKKILADFQIMTLEPLKAIESAVKNKDYPFNQQAMCLSLGLGLTYLDIPLGLRVNLIEGKIKKAKRASWVNLSKRALFFSALLLVSCVFLLDVKLIKQLREQAALFKKSEYQVSSILPEMKVLTEENEDLEKKEKFLAKSLNQQALYLKSLAVLSESKPSGVTIKEVDAEAKDNKLLAVISASAANYEDINIFLGDLKKKDNIKDVKVVASTFPSFGSEAKDIDFKLRFEMPSPKEKAEK
ncbi:MAG: hypothetical protein ABIG31_01385 [Candidatus Omnitrophota bacterium]